MYKINFFLALAISINIYANNNYENFECYSTTFAFLELFEEHA